MFQSNVEILSNFAEHITNIKIDDAIWRRMWIYLIYGYQILKWIVVSWLRDSPLSYYSDLTLSQ